MIVRGNFWDGDDETFVIIENDFNRVTGDKEGDLFAQVNVFARHGLGDPWNEILVWDAQEWREPGNCAFEAILGIVAKIAAGIRVETP